MMRLNINFYYILFLYRHNYTVNNSYMKNNFQFNVAIMTSLLRFGVHKPMIKCSLWGFSANFCWESNSRSYSIIHRKVKWGLQCFYDDMTSHDIKWHHGCEIWCYRGVVSCDICDNNSQTLFVLIRWWDQGGSCLDLLDQIIKQYSPGLHTAGTW